MEQEAGLKCRYCRLPMVYVGNDNWRCYHCNPPPKIEPLPYIEDGDDNSLARIAAALERLADLAERHWGEKK